MTDSRRVLPTGALLFAGVFLLAALLRLPGITRSLGHDEVYTWVIFASRPLLDIFTSYPLPNNHILHTLSVRLVASIFGDAEWSLRLPALLAGLFAIPVLFGFARRLTQSDAVGLGSALLVDALSWLALGGARDAWVNTQPDNDRARALYLRHGFEEKAGGLTVLRHVSAR